MQCTTIQSLLRAPNANMKDHLISREPWAYAPSTSMVGRPYVPMKRMMSRNHQNLKLFGISSSEITIALLYLKFK